MTVLLNRTGRIYGYAAVGGINRLSSAAVINDGSGLLSSYSSASTITPTAGTNRCAVLMVGTEQSSIGSADDIAAVWGAGNSFTRVAFSGTPASSTRPVVAFFYMLNANIPASTQTITVTATQLRGVYAHLVEYEAVAQSTPFGTPVNLASGGFGSSRGVSVTLTDADSVMLSSNLAANNTAAPYSVSAGTELFDLVPTSAGYATAGVEDFHGTTGSRTHTYTFAASQESALCGIEMFKA